MNELEDSVYMWLLYYFQSCNQLLPLKCNTTPLILPKNVRPFISIAQCIVVFRHKEVPSLCILFTVFLQSYSKEDEIFL